MFERGLEMVRDLAASRLQDAKVTEIRPGLAPRRA